MGKNLITINFLISVDIDIYIYIYIYICARYESNNPKTPFCTFVFMYTVFFMHKKQILTCLHNHPCHCTLLITFHTKHYNEKVYNITYILSIFQI